MAIETGHDIDELATRFDEDGYVVVSDLLTDDELFELEASLVSLQEDVRRGAIDRSRYGGDYLTSAADQPIDFVNYVKDVTRLAEPAHDAFHHPVLLELLRRCFDGAEPWEMDPEHGTRFGVVYQDARPGLESAYTRIGWHSDHQAHPSSDFYPSIAVTVHLDATSPANGFLRAVPGSHRWPTDGMPPAGIDAVVELDRRREADRAVVEGHREHPPSDAERAAAVASLREAIAEEPW